MCSCQLLNRNPKGAPTIQQLTIQPAELSKKRFKPVPQETSSTDVTSAGKEDYLSYNLYIRGNDEVMLCHRLT